MLILLYGHCEHCPAVLPQSEFLRVGVCVCVLFCQLISACAKSILRFCFDSQMFGVRTRHSCQLATFLRMHRFLPNTVYSVGPLYLYSFKITFIAARLFTPILPL